MNQNNEGPDFNPLMRGMQGEFGVLRASDGERNESQPSSPSEPSEVQMGPTFATPQPAPTRQIMLRLPRHRAVAAWVLLGLNILIYLVSIGLSYMTGGNLFEPSAGVLELLGWKENVLIFNGQYWRLFTAMFLHASLIHILFNGYALYALGPETERIYGTVRFLAVYLLGGLTGSVASYVFSASPSVGASGAIFGLFGALSAFYYVSRRVLGDIARSQLQSMAAVLFINLLIGFSAGGVIDNFAHLGGLAGGAIIGLLLAPRLEVDTRLYPPVVVQHHLPYGWPATAAFAVLLAALVAVVTPKV